MHSPPHPEATGRHLYHLSAASFEHSAIIGESPERLASFSETLCRVLLAPHTTIHAWCVLPNHYHILVELDDLKDGLVRIGRLHGRTSFLWNREDNTRGRQCWHACADRRIRSSAHFHAARNYIHHNPVKHGYVTKWEEWPFSSAATYLDEVGREEALDLWERYPVHDMGKGWDWG
jgi:putative transposase